MERFEFRFKNIFKEKEMFDIFRKKGLKPMFFEDSRLIVVNVDKSHDAYPHLIDLSLKTGQVPENIKNMSNVERIKYIRSLENKKNEYKERNMKHTPVDIQAMEKEQILAENISDENVKLSKEIVGLSKENSDLKMKLIEISSKYKKLKDKLSEIKEKKEDRIKKKAESIQKKAGKIVEERQGKEKEEEIED